MKRTSNSEILVLSEDGTNLGHMPYRDAQTLASSRNLDLVSVNQSGGVEVFKIMDHGKWKYDKKKHKQKKPHHHVKEMNFKIRIDPHDQEIKINRIKEFLEKGHDVKIAVQLRGREKANPKSAHDKLDEVLKVLEGDVQVQQRRGSQSMAFVVVRPVHKKDGNKRNEDNQSDRGVDQRNNRSDSEGNSNDGRSDVCSSDENSQISQDSQIQNKNNEASASDERRVTV